MTNQYKLYVEVEPFYIDLVETLEKAKKEISLLYFTFDNGEWAGRIIQVLAEKSAQGLRVRLMVDLFGLFGDNVRHSIKNLVQVRRMREVGIEVVLFQPGKKEMSFADRLHCKVCAVDENVMYIGGSNIGDYYLDWQDSNLRVEGDLQEAGHRLYDFIVSHAIGHQGEAELDLDHFWVGDAQAFLTVPGKRQDIADNLLDLVMNTDDKVFFRNWYFLPNEEFMKTMMEKLADGVGFKVLFSHRTRVPIIDIANHTATKTLVKKGAEIFRYSPRFMHSKVTWNMAGEIIFGSANLDDKALKGNFEFCIRFRDMGLAQELTRHFQSDLEHCHHQTREVVEKRALTKRAFSRLLALATPLL